jgi:hypothetical protein
MGDLLYSRWRHMKTNHVYFIVGQCRIEALNEAAFLYVRDDDRSGIPWAREKTEFLDGRFVRLTI